MHTFFFKCDILVRIKYLFLTVSECLTLSYAHNINLHPITEFLTLLSHTTKLFSN